MTITQIIKIYHKLGLDAAYNAYKKDRKTKFSKESFEKTILKFK
jgi:hypothetical protein